MTESQAQLETLRQFRLRMAREIAAEYGVSITEAMGVTDFHDGEWRTNVEQFAGNGGMFTAAWLNTLDPVYRRHLLKHYRESFPRAYVLPECRTDQLRAAFAAMGEMLVDAGAAQ